jgi:cytochrome c peroxidase
MNRNSILNISNLPVLSDTARLGRLLFFDTRLSDNNTISCTTCHKPKLAFTDGLVKSKGIFNRKAFRNAPTLLNVVNQQTFMFDGQITSLEQQVLAPIQDHREMGISMQKLILKLQSIESYRIAAKKIFNKSFDASILTRSIAAYERTFRSHASRFDRFYFDKDTHALSDDERAGWKLFSEKLTCTKCHPAPTFTTNKTENNGLYLHYPFDSGRFRVTHDSSDIGKFKVPTLKNCSLTSPYMHDGSIQSLGAVVEHYQKGGKHPQNQSKDIQAFHLTPQEKRCLILFLKSLTDTNLIIIN